MALETGNSLYWQTGIDNTALNVGVKDAVGIISNMARAIGKINPFVILGLMASAAFAKILKEVYTFSKELSARYETMGVVMYNVGDVAGYTAAEMDKYQASLEKTGISMLSSRQSLTQMVQAHIDLSKATELGRVAQDAAVIANINSSEAFERLIEGIQKAQPLILRSVGINVTFEESYQKLADTLNKNVDQLTENEKTQARVNVVMERSVDIAGTYESAMNTAGKQALSLARYEENLKVLMGQVFTPAYAKGIEKYTELLKNLLRLFENERSDYEVLSESGRQYISVLKDEKNTLSGLIEKIDGLKKIRKPSIEQSNDLKEAEKQLAIIIGDDFSIALDSATKGLDAYNAAKQRTLDLDKEMIAVQVSVFEAELELAKIRKEQFELQKDETTETLRGIAAQRVELEKQIHFAVLGFTSRVGLGFTPEKTRENITIEAEKTTKWLKEQGIVIDNLETKLTNLTLQKFQGTDVTKEELSLYDEILDKSSELLKLDLEFRKTEVERTAEMRKQNLEIERLEKALTHLRRGENIPEIISPAAITAEPGRNYGKYADAEARMYADREKRIAQEMIDSNEAKKEIDKEYLYWKVSQTEIGLQLIIAETEDEIQNVGDRVAFEKGLYEDLEKWKNQLAELRKDKNKKTLDQLIVDTRGWSKEQLQIHANMLKEEIEGEEGNMVFKKQLFEEYRVTMQKVYDAEIQKIKEIGSAVRALSDFIGQFDSELGSAIADMSELTSAYSQFQSASTTTGKAGAGIGAATTTMGIMDTLAKKFIFNNDKIEKSLARIARATEVFDGVVRDVGESIDKAMGEEKLYYIEKGYSRIQDQIRDLRKALAKAPFSKDLQEGLALAKEKLKDMMFEYDKILTGTTSQSITDSITDGLRQGLDTAEVFANTFEDLMKDALWGAFNRNIMSTMMEPWYGKFANLAIGGLNAEEIAVLKESFTLMSGDVKDAFDTMKDITEDAGISLFEGTDVVKKQGMAGAISGITESTAGLLEGQFNAVRMNTESMKIDTGKMLGCFDNLIILTSKIADNTTHLEPMHKTLRSMDRKMTVIADTIPSGMRAIGV